LLQFDLLTHAGPLLLVDDDLVLHKVEVADSVRLGRDATDLADVLVRLLPQILADLLPVVETQIIDD
jgi:hypothetical protein